ncbi:serine protease [Streptomyces sp. GXMU-J5]|uniref:Serine protease n=1 Tax=Streptomyces beihaiensis TaxID=2984495 RepID=A0ABT3TTD0_9ACTN|nr:serine protease [Streptomyces beihaiensis]
MLLRRTIVSALAVFGLAVTGSAPAHAITGGEAASLDTAPYMVSIQAQGWSGSFRHICGGFLRGPHKVVTAAHCLDGQTSAKLRVAWGGTNRSSLPNKSAVSAIKIHPSYDAASLRNDVGVLTLATAASENNGVRYAKLATSDPAPGQSLTLAGWGHAAPDTTALPEGLQAARMPVTTSETCATDYSTPLTPFDTTGRFCAGPADGSKAICRGDAGGPAILNGTVVGVISGGRGCGLPDSPAILSSTAHFNAWLSSQ